MTHLLTSVEVGRLLAEYRADVARFVAMVAVKGVRL